MVNSTNDKYITHNFQYPNNKNGVNLIAVITDTKNMRAGIHPNPKDLTNQICNPSEIQKTVPMIKKRDNMVRSATVLGRSEGVIYLGAKRNMKTSTTGYS